MQQLEADGPCLRHPCIVFALAREAMHFWRDFPVQQRIDTAPCRAWLAGPAWLTVVVLETGVGTHSMAAALNWLLSQPVVDGLPYRPDVVILAGFSGALTPKLAVGDIVVADEVLSERSRWRTTWPALPLEGAWQPPLRSASILCDSAIVSDPAEKLRLGQSTKAVAVDMESAYLASRCTERNLPFACVRAISDDSATALSPHLVRLLDRGSPALLAVVLFVIRRPWLLTQLWKLARNTDVAARQLALALGELLTLTLP